MQTDLTGKQREYLAYLEGWIAREGRAPSLRQAAGDLGVSHAAVAQSLRALEDKGYIKREGRYSRTIHLLNQPWEALAARRWREVPIIGRVTAGLPMYAQTEWDGSVLLDAAVFRGGSLFALRVKGNSMTGAGILNGDLAICEPRQYAEDGEIVVALIDGEEATVKRFFLGKGHIELRPSNSRFRTMKYDFGQVLIQGKVIGIQRGPDGVT